MSRNYDNVRLESRDGIVSVTIDRPRVLNALDRQTIAELGDAFGEIAKSQSVDVVILRGAGERAFAAGADIEELATLDYQSGRQLSADGQSAFSKIDNLAIPVIAAIRGYALGGGCELAMACTLRFASENAVFGQPEVRLGLIPGYGGTWRLPRLVGRGRALELLLTGERIKADEAFRIGLVNRVFPDGELDSGVEEVARRIQANGPLAVRRCIEAVSRGADAGSAEGFELEAELFGQCCSTEDMKEGTRAFLEKRVARFKGH